MEARLTKRKRLGNHEKEGEKKNAGPLGRGFFLVP
jgi:hypothetical protein